MRRVRRNDQPIAGFYLEGLPAHNWLPAIVAVYGAPLAVDQMLPVGNLAANNHLSSSAGEDIEVVDSRVLFRVVPNTIDLGQAQHRLLSVHSIEHAHCEIASA